MTAHTVYVTPPTLISSSTASSTASALVPVGLTTSTSNKRGYTWPMNLVVPVNLFVSPGPEHRWHSILDGVARVSHHSGLEADDVGGRGPHPHVRWGERAAPLALTPEMEGRQLRPVRRNENPDLIGDAKLVAHDPVGRPALATPTPLTLSTQSRGALCTPTRAGARGGSASALRHPGHVLVPAFLRLLVQPVGDELQGCTKRRGSIAQ
eukprot:5098990-Prymnesium_polylepis.2